MVSGKKDNANDSANSNCFARTVSPGGAVYPPVPLYLAKLEIKTDGLVPIVVTELSFVLFHDSPR